MKVNFKYSSDIEYWSVKYCGKGGSYGGLPTRLFSGVTEKYGDTFSQDQLMGLVNQYLRDRNLDIDKAIERAEQKWGIIETEFVDIAETNFGIKLSGENYTCFLTLHDRCPYSLGENFFCTWIENKNPELTIMHELWHFYTWEKFGTETISRIGKERYEDLKEALTVLINIYCKDLLPEGGFDGGYKKHKELRDKILDLHSEGKSLDEIWETMVSDMENKEKHNELKTLPKLK